MAVNLSPIWGAGAQLLDNSGNVLSGGKIYTYAAGTTTPAETYTSFNGITANSNPIILNSAGRVPYEIWLTDTISYKFVLKDSNDTLIATYDNLIGINSNFIAYTSQQEIQTATAGQTVFNLTTMQYQPGTNNLAVYVDGVNQYGPGAQYAFVETDSDTVTFVSGLHVGASVKFTTATPVASAATNAENVAYEPPFTGSVGTNVELKLAQTVSVKDFGAVGDGVTDDTDAINNALAYLDSLTDGPLPSLFFPAGIYRITEEIIITTQYLRIHGETAGRKWNKTVYTDDLNVGSAILYDGSALPTTTGCFRLGNFALTGQHGAGIVLENLSFLCQGLCNAIYGEQWYFAEARHLYIQEPITAIVMGSGCYATQINKVEIYDPSEGGVDIRATSNVAIVRDCSFSNPRVGTNTPTYGVRIADDSNCANVSLYGNAFDFFRCTYHVYVRRDCWGLNINGNGFEGRGDGYTTANLYLNGGSGISVNGNRFTSSTNGTDLTVPINYGVYCSNNCESVSIEGNYFGYFDIAAIHISNGAHDIFAAGNMCAATVGTLPLFSDNNTSVVNAYVQEGIYNGLVVAGRLSFGDPTSYTIASGVVTIGNVSFAEIATQGGAATDDLDTINGGVSGQLLILQPASGANDVVVKDGTGNINLAGGDFTMNTKSDKITLIWNDEAGFWNEISRADN